MVVESARLLGAQRVFTLLIALVSAIGVFAGVAVSGQGIADERQVLASIDDADTTTIVIRDVDGNADLTSEAVNRINALSHVRWAIGLGPALDAANARIGSAPDTPVKLVVGTAPPLEVLASDGVGAWLSPDVRRSLHLQRAAGGIRRSDANEYAVLGEFTASEPAEHLNGFALINDPDDISPLSEIIISVNGPGAVAVVSDAARAVAGPEAPASISVEAPQVLAEVRQVVSGDVRAQGRRSVLAVLATASVITAVVAFAAVSARRRDFGRRRALGARRSDLVILIVAHIVMASSLGSIVGWAAGTVVVRTVTDQPVDLAYPAAVATLMILTSALAGFWPAVLAAVRDPLSVLRSA